MAHGKDELILRIKPNLKDENLSGERSRLNHHIRQLKTYGLIGTKKSGKNIVIQREALGELYIKGEQIKELKKDLEMTDLST